MAASGVAHVLRPLRDELKIAMVLCGCRTLEQAAEVLAPPGLVPQAQRSASENQLIKRY